ncbi:MAG: alkaline phosphatase D family protein [Pseudomonadota bacterium]|nr:alkaline phosphatase D family protein [Pseudomonadota bacterium]
MSGPRIRAPRFHALSRRDFLRRAALGSVALGSLPMLPACGSSDGAGGRGPDGGDLEFRHGVASGDPLADRVMLWTRVSGMDSGSVSVSYSVWSDPSLSQLVTSGSASTDASRDYTVKVDVGGLQPGTSYYYRFDAGSAQSLVGRTRTAPEGATGHLRIGVVSCSSLAHGYFNAYRKIAERSDLDVVLHLGDYIYEYGTSQYGEVRAYEPAHEILTLEDYRIRHAQYKQDPDLQEAHRQHPFINIWDDHETADNSWNAGANNHAEGAEGVWAQRKAWAIQAYYEWLPIRQVDPSQPERIYRSFRYGDLADLVMLDTRLIGRDLQASLVDAASINDEERHLLGATQLTWLGEQLAQTGATWKLLGQQVMFGQLRIPNLPELSVLTGIPIEQLQTLLSSLPVVSTGGLIINTDQWDGYRAERARVYALLESLNVENPVVLTGDIHTSWSMDLSPDPGNPLVYNPLTGAGSRGVEFVCTSVTSPGLDALNPLTPVLQLLNPHMKHVNLEQQGYLLLDIQPERLVGEHWYTSIEQGDDTETFGAAYLVDAGTRHLVAASATEPRTDMPAPAP